MKIRILHSDKHTETIDDTKSAIIPLTKKGDIEITTASQRTKRDMDDIICFEVTRNNGNLLHIDDINGVNPGPRLEMVTKAFIDKNYGMDRLYVEGFYDDDGKGAFHRDIARALICDTIIEGAKLSL